MSTPEVWVRGIECRKNGEEIKFIPVGVVHICKCLEVWVPVNELPDEAELWLVDYKCIAYDLECMTDEDKNAVRLKVLKKEGDEALLVDYEAPDDVLILTDD